MIVVNRDSVKAADRPQVTLKTLFAQGAVPGGNVTFGTIVIPPKTRVPVQGEGAHDEDEYSFIIRGSILTCSGGVEQVVSAGEATLIPAGESHWAYNAGDEDCEIVWALVKRK